MQARIYGPGSSSIGFLLNISSARKQGPQMSCFLHRAAKISALHTHIQCIYIYMDICACIYQDKHTENCIPMYTHMCRYIGIYIHMCILLCIHAKKQIYISIRICIHICMHVRTYVCRYTCFERCALATIHMQPAAVRWALHPIGCLFGKLHP